MTHLAISEWGRVPVEAGADGFSRTQANALLAAARAHRSGGREGTAILTDHHRHLTAGQVVGVLAAPGCSLEILPKVDPSASQEMPATVRRRLIHMLDVALGLGLSQGGAAPLARQSETLLDILIRIFTGKLLDEVRRGLPRLYVQCEDDLPALRGRLDVVRQFTAHAVRPDRLACCFDALTVDTPLLQIMKAAVVFLGKHAHATETRRHLIELRHLLEDVRDVPVRALPWHKVQLDRSNRRWRNLLAMARLFLKRDWQATHREARAGEGITLLFPMNDLFEAYVAALLRRALAGSGIEVVSQGGLKSCLGEWTEGEDCTGTRFQTKPDIILRRAGRDIAIIDTKWKKLGALDDPKHGVSHADVYQLMAYARLYDCSDLMLLYPATPGADGGVRRNFGIHGGSERLRIATLDVARSVPEIVVSLRALAQRGDRLQNGSRARNSLVSLTG